MDRTKEILTLVGIIIGLVVICVLAIDGCNRKKAPIEPTYTQRQIDSVKAEYEQSEKILQRIAAEKTKIAYERDSLSSVADQTSKKLEIQTLRVKVLTREAQLAREKEDKGEFILACDSLIPQVDSLLTVSDHFRGQSRSLQNSYDSLLGVTSFHIARLEFDQSVLRERFDNVAGNALNLEAENKVLAHKAKKRWIIGPFAGATYNGSSIAPTAGVGVSFRIIRL